MTEALVLLAVVPLWLASASGFAVGVAAHFIARPWEFLS